MTNTPPVPIISLVNDQPRTLSTDVAAFFSKQHKDVLKLIRNIMANCPESFNGRNFAPVEITDAKGEKRPAYSLTKNAFMLVVMGLTGHKAMQCKLAYMARFDAMEAELATHTRDSFQLKQEASPRPLDGLSTVKDRKPLNALLYTWVDLASQANSVPRHILAAWSLLLTAFGYREAAAIPRSQLEAIGDWVQIQIGQIKGSPPAKALPAPVKTLTAPPPPADLYEVVRAGAKRALDNYQMLTRLEIGTLENYKMLDDALTALGHQNPYRAASA